MYDIIISVLYVDVAGGQSCSILDAMRQALQVSCHLSLTKDNYEPINYKDVLYLATLGGATGMLPKVAAKI